MKNILLIDGNSIAYRSYYGSAYSRNGILSTSFGQPTNAILTFNKVIKKVIKKYNPSHIFIAFDAGSKTFRHKEMENYKAERKKTPIELLSQLPIIKEMINLMGIKCFELNLIEADDIIATMSKKYENENKIKILSSDKDLLQLVGKNVEAVQPQNGKNEDKIIDINNFYEINGHHPNQVIDFKGLVGDSSDNLPGIKGVGPKSANKLLKKYENLENIFKNINNIEGTLKDKLLQDKEIGLKCKKMATLKIDVEIPYSLKDIVYSHNHPEELINFYKKYELKSLINSKKNNEKEDGKNKSIIFKNIFF